MIRNFKSSDTGAILSIWRAASDRAHPFLTPDFQDQEAENIRNIYISATRSWIAEVDGAPQGFLSLIEPLEVGAIFVRPRSLGCRPWPRLDGPGDRRTRPA